MQEVIHPSPVNMVMLGLKDKLVNPIVTRNPSSTRKEMHRHHVRPRQRAKQRFRLRALGVSNERGSFPLLEHSGRCSNVVDLPRRTGECGEPGGVIAHRAPRGTEVGFEDRNGRGVGA